MSFHLYPRGDRRAYGAAPGHLLIAGSFNGSLTHALTLGHRFLGSDTCAEERPPCVEFDSGAEWTCAG